MHVWQENLNTRARLEEYEIPQAITLRVPVPGGFQAMVKLYLPQEIDLLAATYDTQYPMIVNVYAGPDSVYVLDSFSIGYKDYLVTTRKIIYCQIDGRGSGNKGKDMLFTLNNKLGNFEMEDQIFVTKYLQNNYKFIDATRTGVWGWSYGGYATAIILAKDSELVFKCGISGAPVTSWIYNDSIYTERYMSLPTLQDNLAN